MIKLHTGSHSVGQNFSLFEGFISIGLVQILFGFSFNHAPHQ